MVEPDPTDARKLSVSLTKQGGSTAALAEQAMLTWVAIVGEGTSRADLQTVDAVFDSHHASAVRHFTGCNGSL